MKMSKDWSRKGRNYYDDEWGSSNDYRESDKKKRNIRDRRKNKQHQKDDWYHPTDDDRS